MLRAGGQIHIPVARLGEPAGAQHLPAAHRAEVFASGHGGQGLALVGVVPEDFSVQAAGELCPVEAVFVAADGLVVFLHAPLQIQPLADQGGMVGIPQGIVGRAAGGNLEGFQGGFQCLLGAGAVGLGVENHLGIVPVLHPAMVQGEELEVFPEDADVVKAPGEEHRVFPAPAAEGFHGAGEADPLGPEAIFLDAGELTDPAIQVPVDLGGNHNLEFIRRVPRRAEPDGADLDNLPPDGHRQHLLRRRRAGPGLIPFHIQDNKIHCNFPLFLFLWPYHTTTPPYL